jgi:hypothetical protein
MEGHAGGERAPPGDAQASSPPDNDTLFEAAADAADDGDGNNDAA